MIKIDKLNLIILLAIGILVVPLFNYSFSFVSSGTVRPLERQDLGVKNAISSFDFTPKRQGFIGVVVNFKRNFYIEDEQDKILSLSVAFQGNQEFYTRDYRISEIKSGNQLIELPNLQDTKGKTIRVTFVARSDLKSPTDLQLINQDYNPVPEINSAQRLVYKTSLQEISNDLLDHLNQDRRFRSFYFITLYLLIGSMTIILLFKKK